MLSVILEKVPPNKIPPALTPAIQAAMKSNDYAKKILNDPLERLKNTDTNLGRSLMQKNKLQQE